MIKLFFTKEYTGSIRCTNCNKMFNWKYIDNGYRPWMKSYKSPVFSYGTDKTIAICKLIRDLRNNKIYFKTECPHCHSLISFDCNEDIAKELNS